MAIIDPRRGTAGETTCLRRPGVVGLSSDSPSDDDEKEDVKGGCSAMGDSGGGENGGSSMAAMDVQVPAKRTSQIHHPNTQDIYTATPPLLKRKAHEGH